MHENQFNIWEAYGFKGNPFDTHPLSLYRESPLSIEKAFIGRRNTDETELLFRLLGCPGGNRVVIEGEVGVGKTTFINYHRYFWEHMVDENQRLFSCFGEIPIYHNWQVKDFLLNILSHILHKLVLVYGIKTVSSDPLFEEMLMLDKVYQQHSYQIEGQFLGFGGGYGRNKQTTIPSISESRLQIYIQEAIEAICRKNYRGIILHFDNLELLETSQIETTQQIFQNLRDIFQTTNMYSIFIGPTGFFRKIISPLERVRSIFFGWPIYVPPLTKTEVLQVIDRRYELMAMKKLCWVKPVEEDCIPFLYDLYDGKIRFIMDTLQAIPSRFPKTIGKTLSLQEMQQLLFGFMEEKILQVLSTREFEILIKAASVDKFTNVQLASHFKLDKGNVTRYLQKFLKFGFIKVIKREGRNVFYEVSEDIKILYRSKNFYSQQETPKDFLQPRQKKLLQYIETVEYTTIRDVASYLKIAYSTSRQDLEILVREKLIQKKIQGKKFLFSRIT